MVSDEAGEIELLVHRQLLPVAYDAWDRLTDPDYYDAPDPDSDNADASADPDAEWDEDADAGTGEEATSGR
jgi:hypothetical protein